jgi:hypothetical protein
VRIFERLERGTTLLAIAVVGLTAAQLVSPTTAATAPPPIAVPTGESPLTPRPPASVTFEPRPPPAIELVGARPGQAITLHTSPGEAVLATVARTQFGSPTEFPVFERHGVWVGVPYVGAGNGRLAWIDTRRASLTWAHSALKIDVNVPRRRLELLDGDRTIVAATVGVGASGSPTPHGRFAVTDKLPGPQFNAAYGCCIIALSATQNHPPPGWTGGDRIAIHGTDEPETIGEAASTGCVHGTQELMETLMRLVPLGTPVLIE